LTIDTLRPDYLSLNGYDRATTPFLDGFLADAFQFSRAVTPIARTTPALASLLTGAYPHTTGVRTLTDSLSDKVTSIAEVFREAGYQTVAVVTNNVLKPERRLDRGFDVYDMERDIRTAPETTAAAIQHLSGLDDSRPIFVWVHYIDPHAPYDCDTSIIDQFDPDYQGRYQKRFGLQPPAGSPLNHIIPYPKDLGMGSAVYRNTLPEPVNAHVRRLYAADIRSTDNQLAPLVEAVRKKTAGNLITVLTSDHGESLGEHDYYYYHGDYVYNAALRVPLFVRLPEEHPAFGFGRSIEWVSLIDVVPTLFELMGRPIPETMRAQMEGRSLVPCFFGEPAASVPVFAESGRAFAFDLIHRRVKNTVAGRFRAVIFDDHKLIWTPFQSPEREWELYDLRRDPDETKNLYRAQDPRVEKLRSHLHSWIRATQEEKSAELSEDDKEILQALGYMQK